jgi:LysR family hydrogen peroxide-inducible transcriptional activator
MRDLPTIRQLECFVVLAASRSFRRAAEQLAMSQPSLSVQIRNLETTLGLTLVERRAVGAELTPVGREALTHAQVALQAARALSEFANAAQVKLTGRIRLGVSSTIGPYLLPSVVARLHRSYPDLRLYVRESAPEELVRELMEGQHDTVLVQLPVRAEQCHVEELFRERLLVLLASDHPLASNATVAADALAGQDVLTLDARYGLSRQTADMAETFGARLSTDYQSGSLDAIRLMVGMGAGLAFAPELYVRSEVRAGGDVVARPLKGRAIHRLIGLCWRRSLQDCTTMERLAEAAREAFTELTRGPLTL